MTFKMPFLKQFDAKTSIEQGRSMVEILGVLAVIGVLSAGGIYGYIYAMKKYTANLLVHEARLAWANEQGSESQETNWIPVNFTPKCGYNMLTGKDEDGDTFVLVEGIDKEMCQILMQLGNNDMLSFYKQVELEETNVALVTQCPSEPLDIIFAFDGTRAPGKDCETGEECADFVGGYCNTDTGTCHDCPDGKEPNESQTLCNPICDTETESECWLDERRWCCGGNTICGENIDECVESDGFCKYRFENIDMTLQTNCSLDVSSDVMMLATNCAFKNGLASDGETLNMAVEGTPCPSGQYCYLSFQTTDCSTSVSASGAQTIYGVCTDMDKVNASCLVQKATGGDMVTTDKGCSSGQYCYASFSNNTCTGSASSNHSGIIYGVCTDMDKVNASCQPKESDFDRLLSPQIDCPKQQYCYLAFKSKGCSNKTDAKGSNPLWGVCLDMDAILSDLEECPVVE